MPKERRGQVICLLLGEREGQGKESRERRRRASARCTIDRSSERSGQAEATSVLALPSRAARASLLKASRNCVTSITDSTYLRVSDRRRASEALAARTA